MKLFFIKYIVLLKSGNSIENYIIVAMEITMVNTMENTEKAEMRKVQTYVNY